MSLRKPIFISAKGYSEEMDGYADSINLNAIQLIDSNGVAKVNMDGTTGDLTAAGILNVAGDGYFAQALAVQGATDLNGALAVAGDGYFAQALAVQGAADFASSLSVAGDGYFAQALSVLGESTLASAIVSDLTQTRVVFAGADGALVDDAALSFASNTLTVGDSSAAGTVSVKDMGGEASVLLDGMSASITAQTGNFGYTASWGNVAGTVNVKNDAGDANVVLDGFQEMVSATNLVSSSLTAGRVALVGTSPNYIGGKIEDSADLTFQNSSLTVTAGAQDPSILFKRANGQIIGQISSDSSYYDMHLGSTDWENPLAGKVRLADNAASGSAVVMDYTGLAFNSGATSKVTGLSSSPEQADWAASKGYVDGYVNSAFIQLDGYTGDGYFAGDLNVLGETTLASAIVSDLTETRVVFAGANGALVDDGAFTFDSSSKVLALSNLGAFVNIDPTNGEVNAKGGFIAGGSGWMGYASFKDPSNASRVYIDGNNSRLALRDGGELLRAQLEGSGDASSLRLLDGNSKERAKIDLNEVKIVAESTDARFLASSTGFGVYDESNVLRVASSGGNGNLRIRTGGDADAAVITTEYGRADFELGGTVNSRLIMKDSSNYENIQFTGEHGDGYLAGKLEVGALDINFDGYAFIQHLQMPVGLAAAGTDAVNRDYVDGYVSDLLLQINAASDSSFSDFVAAESLALGNPVFIDTAGKAAKADADLEDKSWVMGVARAAASADASLEIIRDGVCPGALTGLSFAAADQIWLAPGGGLVNARPTATGARLILIGFAKSANDLFVDIRDYGRNV